MLQKKGRSQRWLAQQSGIHYVTINRIINGYRFRMTDSTAWKLARAISGDDEKERDSLIKLARYVPRDVEAILLRRPDLVELVRKHKH